MRIKHIITAFLVLAGIVTAQAALASQGSGNREDSSGPRPERELRGGSRESGKEIEPRGGRGEDSPRDRLERAAGNEMKDSGMDSARDREERAAAFTSKLNEKGTDIRDAFKEHREAIVSDIRKAREEFRASVEERKAEIKAAVEGRKAELKEKLAAFKDSKKAEIAGRLDTTFGNINERWIAFFGNSTDRIENALDAISSRADKAEAAGKDVAAVRARISAASDAIAGARAAIATQAGKDYTLEIGSETTVRSDASETRDLLRADLQKVRDAVRAAFDATKEAAKAMRAVPGIAEVEVETTTTPAN